MSIAKAVINNPYLNNPFTRGTALGLGFSIPVSKMAPSIIDKALDSAASKPVDLALQAAPTALAFASPFLAVKMMQGAKKVVPESVTNAVSSIMPDAVSDVLFDEDDSKDKKKKKGKAMKKKASRQLIRKAFMEKQASMEKQAFSFYNLIDNPVFNNSLTRWIGDSMFGQVGPDKRYVSDPFYWDRTNKELNRMKRGLRQGDGTINRAGTLSFTLPENLRRSLGQGSGFFSKSKDVKVKNTFVPEADYRYSKEGKGGISNELMKRLYRAR